MKNLKKKLIQVFILLCIVLAVIYIAKQSQLLLNGETNNDIYKVNQKPSFLVIEENISNKKSSFEIDKSIKEESKKIVFTGDSRFVGMSQLKECEEIVFAETGQGYNYFCLLQDSIKNESTDILVIGFGVNDLYNVKKYVNYINNKPFGNIEVYFLTVNPVDEEKENLYGYTVKNEDILDFNNYILENADNYKVIDTNSYLNSIGFFTKDGLHYTDETYLEIYNYIIKEIR